MDNLFGKYQLIRRLAFGGMAEIFLARLHGEGGFSKELVVKRILPQFGEDEDFVRMFIDEAVLAAHINHPNVVQIYDFGSHEGVYFIAMEYIDGIDLRQLLKRARNGRRALHPAEVAAIGEQVAAGLYFAHCAKDAEGRALGLVHRDISPHNIMISRAGDVKIMDFGIAKAHARATKTATGTIKGKVAYMAPEHAGGDAAGAHSDQFSLGAVLWELLAGERLYAGESELELFRDVIGHRIRDLGMFREDVPDALKQVVERTIAKEPSARFDSLAELGTALSHFRFSLGTEGAVQLGALFEELEATSRGTAVLAAPQGTLVLEEPAPSDSGPTASQEREPLGGPRTLTFEEEPYKGGAPATAPRARPGELEDTRRLDESPEYSGVDRQSRVAAPTRGFYGVMAAILLFGVGWMLAGPSSGVESKATIEPMGKSSTSGFHIVSKPPGASVYLDEVLVPQKSPLALDTLTIGSTYKLRVELDGYQPWERELAVSADKQRLDVALIREVEAEKSSGPVAKPMNKAQASNPKPVRSVSRKKAPVSIKRRAPEATAVLDLRSAGAWYDVYLGKERLGTTPLRGVEIPAGRHVLRLVNEEAGLSKKIEIFAKPGGRVRKSVEGD